MGYLKASSESEAKRIAKNMAANQVQEKHLKFYTVYIEKTGLAANRRTSLVGHWKITFETVGKNDFIGSGNNIIFVEDFD